MFDSDSSIGILAGAGLILCGLSWLYWLREIGIDVNKTLPENQRVRWNLTEKVPLKMHWFWREHARLFRQSRKRIYAATSLLLFFLLAIVIVVAYLLTENKR